MGKRTQQTVIGVAIVGIVILALNIVLVIAIVNSQTGQ